MQEFYYGKYEYILDEKNDILKINITNEWPYQIDGIDIDEIFDNILYAG